MAVTSVSNRYFAMDLTRRKLIQSGVVIGGAAAFTDLALSPSAWAVTGGSGSAAHDPGRNPGSRHPGTGGYAPVVVPAAETAHGPHRPRQRRPAPRGLHADTGHWPSPT